MIAKKGGRASPCTLSKFASALWKFSYHNSLDDDDSDDDGLMSKPIDCSVLVIKSRRKYIYMIHINICIYVHIKYILQWYIWFIYTYIHIYIYIYIYNIYIYILSLFFQITRQTSAFYPKVITSFSTINRARTQILWFPRGYLHIESSHKYCKNDSKLETNSPSLINAIMPILQKIE